MLAGQLATRWGVGVDRESQIFAGRAVVGAEAGSWRDGARRKSEGAEPADMGTEYSGDFGA